jgi:hypothetical protein
MAKAGLEEIDVFQANLLVVGGRKKVIRFLLIFGRIKSLMVYRAWI